MSPVPRLAAALLVPILAAGCDAAAGGPATVTVRDSAGIEIVENVRSEWTEGAGWRVSEIPLLEVGDAEGSPEYLLDRVTGAILRDDGTLVVANAGSAEIRYFDPHGTHLRSVGRRGDGPGEFKQLMWLDEYRGDSLIVYDAVRRLSILGPDGGYGRSLTFSAVGGGGTATPIAPFADGSILGRLTIMVGPSEVVTGMRRGDAMYGRFSAADGALIDSLATLPGEERHLLVEPTMLMVTTPVLGAETYAAVHGDQLFLGYSGEQEVRAYGMDGTLRRLIRRSQGAVPVTSGELDRLVEARLEAVDDAAARQRMAEVLTSMPSPEFRPAYSALMTDAEGNLWMRETVLPGEPNGWTIFDPDARMLGTIELPGDFQPLRIGDDFVIGVVTDDLGVERVRLYRLEKQD